MGYPLYQWRRYVSDGGGAATVDYVALSAAAVILGVVLVYGVMGAPGVAGVIDGFRSQTGKASDDLKARSTAPPPVTAASPGGAAAAPPRIPGRLL